MSATAIRERGQTTLPVEVSVAAGLKPGDRVDWRFEDGEIRGRKLAAQPRNGDKLTKAEVLEAIDRSPLRFHATWDELKAETR